MPHPRKRCKRLCFLYQFGAQVKGGGPLEEFRSTLVGRIGGHRIGRLAPRNLHLSEGRQPLEEVRSTLMGRIEDGYPTRKIKKEDCSSRPSSLSSQACFFVLRTRNMCLLEEDSIFPCHHQVPGRRRRRAVNPTAPETRN
jgi:hypothetical protein